MRALLLPLTLCVIWAPSFTQSRVAVSGGPPAGRKAVWILGADGKMSEYDAADFHPWMTGLALPAGARQHPQNISISRKGTIIYADTIAGTHLLRLWSWNRYAQELTGGSQETRPGSNGGSIDTWATPVVYFSDDGARFFWFENRMTVTSGRDGDISRVGEFSSWTTDLHGENLTPVVSFSLGECKCDTGACEESCTEISVWAPETGVSDFFFLTRWVPGQLQPKYQQTDLYRFANGRWSAQKLAHPIEVLLDAANGGDSYIAAVPDSGCCGWENESDDVTYVVNDGRQSSLFDERARFHNDDYDVSFMTAKAGFSPGADRVAYTLTATSKADQEIRLSADGKPNSEELARIRAALMELPRVEVLALADVSKVSLSLPHSELIGWLDQQRLLVFQKGQLFVVDTTSGVAKPTGLTAENMSSVYIR